MSSKLKSTLALLAIPVALLVVAVAFYPNTGEGKKSKHVKKPSYVSFQKAGAHLQGALAQGLAEKGYGFQVIACSREKGYTYICSASVSQGQTSTCMIVSFTDKNKGNVSVEKVDEAKDQTACE